MRAQTVLIVANKGPEASLIADLLGELRFPLAVLAHNGRKAVDDAIVHDPDLAIVDADLDSPFNAIDVTRALRDSLGIPVILLCERQAGPRFTQALGALPQIYRPVRQAELQRAIAACTGRGADEGLDNTPPAEPAAALPRP